VVDLTGDSGKTQRDFAALSEEASEPCKITGERSFLIRENSPGALSFAWGGGRFLFEYFGGDWRRGWAFGMFDLKEKA